MCANFTLMGLILFFTFSFNKRQSANKRCQNSFLYDEDERDMKAEP